MPNQRSRPRTHPDDLDLRDLLLALWARKLLILAIAAFTTCMAIAYAYLATPIYETRVQTLPPSASGLAAYNAASQLTGLPISGVLDADASPGIKELSTRDAYRAFLTQLSSDTVKRKFFDDYYVPAMSQDTPASTQRLWRRLNDELTVTLPTENQTTATVVLTGASPEQIADWANRYVNLAMEATQKELLEDLAGEVEVRRQGVNDQIATLERVAEVDRAALIARLKNALRIAETIGLEEPAAGLTILNVTGGQGEGRHGGASDRSAPLYLRGAKALAAELQQLESRQNDTAYIAELPDLLKKNALLDQIDLSPDVAVARVDAAASIPETPIKPRKLLTILLGLALGLILGVFLSLLRVAIARP